MSATVTRLDAHRPSLKARLTAAVRAWWSGLTDLPDLDMPASLDLLSDYRAVRVQKPLTWPLGIGPNFDEYLFQVARERQLTLRTRGGYRARLAIGNVGDTSYYAMRGEIELPDDCDGSLTWHPLGWFDNGRHALLDHPWDLVSVETASCIVCDHTDMDEDQQWHWLTVDRVKGLGVCSRCTAGEAA